MYIISVCGSGGRVKGERKRKRKRLGFRAQEYYKHEREARKKERKKERVADVEERGLE